MCYVSYLANHATTQAYLSVTRHLQIAIELADPLASSHLDQVIKGIKRVEVEKGQLGATTSYR